MYKVSIIVPIYNVEKYIERCILSLFNQDFESIEYIFVDDCTPDNSIAILKELIEKYPNRKSHARIINHEENKGSGATRKTGILNATGEYTIYIDSDDWCELDMISRLYKYAIDTNSDVVVSDYFKSYPKNLDIYQKQTWCPEFHKNMKNLILGPLHGSLCNKLVRRKLYLENNLLPPEEISLLEDKWVMIRLFLYADKIFHTSNAFLHYWQGNNESIVSTVTPKHWQDFFWYKATTKKFLKDTGNKKYIKYLIMSNLYIYTSLIRKMIFGFIRRKLL